MEINYRKCVTCKEVKEASPDNFYKDKNRKLGLMYRCKICDKLKKDNRTYQNRIETPEKKAQTKLRLKKYNQSDKGRAMSLSAGYKQFDIKKGFYTETISNKYLIDIRANYKCTYCGYPATGLDRIDNKQGHSLSNCVPACMECNVARMDNFTHEEMFIIGKSIKLVKDNRLTINPHFELA